MRFTAMPTVLSPAAEAFQFQANAHHSFPLRSAEMTVSQANLSINQLTNRIDDVIRGRLQDSLHSYWNTDLLGSMQQGSPESMTVVLQDIAIAYGHTCALVWTLSLLEDTPSEEKVETFTASVNTLCTHWLRGRRYYPDADFFCDAKTLGALRSKWQQPAIQQSLRQTTLTLRRGAEGQWIARYPTCWAYAVGRTMHQLLQWNHQLTAETLRECWRVNVMPVNETPMSG